MTTFAVIENDIVINRIVAESKEIAESVTGKTCVECDGTSIVGGSYIDGMFAGSVEHIEPDTSDSIEITDSI